MFASIQPEPCIGGCWRLLHWGGSGAQPDDGEFAVGLLLVFRETVCRAGDVAPGVLAGGSDPRKDGCALGW